MQEEVTFSCLLHHRCKNKCARVAFSSHHHWTDLCAQDVLKKKRKKKNNSGLCVCARAALLSTALSRRSLWLLDSLVSCCSYSIIFTPTPVSVLRSSNHVPELCSSTISTSIHIENGASNQKMSRCFLTLPSVFTCRRSSSKRKKKRIFVILVYFSAWQMCLRSASWVFTDAYFSLYLSFRGSWKSLTPAWQPAHILARRSVWGPLRFSAYACLVTLRMVSILCVSLHEAGVESFLLFFPFFSLLPVFLQDGLHLSPRKPSICPRLPAAAWRTAWTAEIMGSFVDKEESCWHLQR